MCRLDVKNLPTGIIAFQHPESARLHAALEEANVHVMRHAGRIRVADSWLQYGGGCGAIAQRLGRGSEMNHESGCLRSCNAQHSALHMTPELVGTHVSQWGEGPLWHDKPLLYVDIEAHKILSFDPVTGKETIWTLASAWAPAGGARASEWAGLGAGDDGLLLSG